MRAFALATLISIAMSGAGCLKASFTDGQLTCSSVPNRQCPEGHHCELNNYCYLNGHHPVFDLAVTPVPTFDFSVSAPQDLSASAPADLQSPDLSPAPPDLLSTTD